VRIRKIAAVRSSPPVVGGFGDPSKIDFNSRRTGGLGCLGIIWQTEPYEPSRGRADQDVGAVLELAAYPIQYFDEAPVRS
jgi:hypothetical protein